MTEMRNTYRIMFGKSEEKLPFGNARTDERILSQLVLNNIALTWIRIKSDNEVM
jgi:hypothetical protein